jgi:hypothetical protein
MAIDLIITIAVIVLCIYVILKIVKKAAKIGLTALLVVFVVLFSVHYMIKLDTSQLSRDLEQGVVYMHEDVAYETGPFKIIARENVSSDYQLMLGNKTRIIIYKNLSLSGNYSQKVSQLQGAVSSNKSVLLQQVRNNETDIYPDSPVVTCAKKCPYFILRMYMN